MVDNAVNRHAGNDVSRAEARLHIEQHANHWAFDRLLEPMVRRAVSGADVSQGASAEAVLRLARASRNGDHDGTPLAMYSMSGLAEYCVAPATAVSPLPPEVSLQEACILGCAVPTASSSAVRLVENTADEVICLDTPPSFSAVGYYYRDFGQTTDDEVREMLQEAWHARSAA